MATFPNCSINCSSPIINSLPHGHIITIGLINALGSATGTIGNTIVFVYILVNWRMRHNFHILLLSLTISSLLVCVVLQTYRADAINPFFTIGISAKIASIVSILAYFSFLFGIVGISIDRLISVWKPFQYENIITHTRTIIFIGLIWILSIIPASFLYKLKYRKTFDKLALILFSVAFVILLSIFTFIFFKLYKDNVTITRPSRDNSNRNVVQREFTKIAAIIATTLAILWLPALIYLYVMDILDGKTQDIDVYIVGQYLISLHLWNSSLNWYIFTWNSSEFNKFVGRFLRCKTTQPSVQTEDKTQNINLDTIVQSN